jgi:DNA-damage-inducible protein J
MAAASTKTCAQVTRKKDLRRLLRCRCSPFVLQDRLPLRRGSAVSKTQTVRARVEPKLKRSAEAVFKKMGLSSSQAITLFLTQVKLQKGLPFAMNIPNKETRRAIREARERKNLETFETFAAWAKDTRSR